MTAIDGGQGWAVAGGSRGPAAPAWRSAEGGPEGGAFAGAGEALRTAGHWLGAAASIALVAGIGFWGWQTVTREAQGVPIVRALAGEMRVAPERAGGAVMPDQGLTLGSVQEGRGTAEAPDAVTLAPTGIDIAVEDRLVPVEVEAEAEAAPEIAALPPTEMDVLPFGDENEPLDGTALLDLEIVSAALPGVAASPRPSGRPAILAALGAALSARPAAASEAPPQRVPVDPAGIADGTPMVELGDYSSLEGAQDAWDALSTAGPGTLDAKSPVIVSADDGDVWHLRATGFGARGDAAAFCATLRGEGVDCVPVDQG